MLDCFENEAFKRMNGGFDIFECGINAL